MTESVRKEQLSIANLSTSLRWSVVDSVRVVPSGYCHAPDDASYFLDLGNMVEDL
jgi:hypothetical protein